MVSEANDVAGLYGFGYIANGVFWCENSKILFLLFFYTQCTTRFSRIYIQVLFLQTLDIVNLVYIKDKKVERRPRLS